MTGSLHIIQITDCHLTADPMKKYRGIKPHQNLAQLIQKIRVLKPDLVLASGDLSEDGSLASYKALRNFFNAIDAPVLALPGNHDHPGLLAQAFPGSPEDALHVTEHGRWQIIRLDSCVAGQPHGRINEASMAALESALEVDQTRPRLISLHHQPLPIGSLWIDKYRLLHPQAFLKVIDKYPCVKAVVWGHIHQPFQVDRKGVAMLGGPSSAINSLPGAGKFTPDPGGPACRWLELQADGTIRTGIVQSGAPPSKKKGDPPVLLGRHAKFDTTGIS